MLTANVRSARSSSGPRPGGHDGHSPPRRGATPSGLRAGSGKISKQFCRFRPLNERLRQLSTVTVGTTPLDRMTANRLLRSILGSGQRSTSGHEPHRGSIRATTDAGRLRRLGGGSANVSYWYPSDLPIMSERVESSAFSGRAYNGRWLGPVRWRRHMPAWRETLPTTEHRRGVTPAALIILRLLNGLRRHRRIEVHASGTIEETPVMRF